MTQQTQVPTTPARDKPNSIEFDATPAMIEAGAATLFEYLYGGERERQENACREMALATYRAMVSKSQRPDAVHAALKWELAHLIAEWEDSGELAGEFADRLLAFFQARKSKFSKSER